VLRTAASFTLGAAVGSLASLLSAPASGKVVRRRLAGGVRQLTRGLGRTARQQFHQTQRALAAQAEHAREVATEWIAGHLPHGNGRPATRRRTVRHAHAQ
jgi:gas vesicle protein